MHNCGYVIWLAAYDFSVFEYHAETYTHPHVRILNLSTYLFLDFDILRIGTAYASMHMDS